ncbi:MAG: patatin-like phospholipase family protein, partial [Cyanobacteria bacterium J06632_3]
MTYKLKNKFKNLVFEGGGVKGAAYVGAMQTLDEYKILDDIERICGTSAGAITAVLMGLGFSVEEAQIILLGESRQAEADYKPERTWRQWATEQATWAAEQAQAFWDEDDDDDDGLRVDFNKFWDDDIGYVRDSIRMLTGLGWCRGDYFHRWISKMIALKTGNPNATFQEVEEMKKDPNNKFKSIYLTGTNLSTSLLEIFSYEHSPHVSIATAARISMSIPLVFRPVLLKRTDKNGNFTGDTDYFVDGGVLDNYPIRLFDEVRYTNTGIETAEYDQANAAVAKSSNPQKRYVYNQETLGFRLDDEQEIAVLKDHSRPTRYPIDGPNSYLSAFYNVLSNAQNYTHLNSRDRDRTIY